MPLYRAATEEELKLCPGDWKYGCFFTTVITQCDRYIPWATEHFTANGGKFFNSKLNSFTDLPAQYDLVINCTGLGAKFLCNDHKIVPMRGQVLKVSSKDYILWTIEVYGINNFFFKE